MDPATLTTLRDYATHHRVTIRCPKCHHETPVNLMRWATLVGWDFSFEKVKPQLRCGECGNNAGIEVVLGREGTG